MCIEDLQSGRASFACMPGLVAARQATCAFVELDCRQRAALRTLRIQLRLHFFASCLMLVRHSPSMRVRSFYYGRSYYGRTLPSSLVRVVDCGQAQPSILARPVRYGLAQPSMQAHSFQLRVGCGRHAQGFPGSAGLRRIIY